MDNVCNRCLFSIPSKVEMAEEQEYLRSFIVIVFICLSYQATVVEEPVDLGTR